MTKLERQGLNILQKWIDATLYTKDKREPEIKAAIDWLERQIKIDARRRKSRGKYRRRR